MASCTVEQRVQQKTECIITIDGEEFIRGEMTRMEALALFGETCDVSQHPELRNEGTATEFALLVYKPRYGGYLRERLVIRPALRRVSAPMRIEELTA